MNITESIQYAIEAWGPKATVAGTAVGAGAVGTLGGYQHGLNNWGRGAQRTATSILNTQGHRPQVTRAANVANSATDLSKDVAGGASKIFKGAANILNKYRSATS